MFCNNGILHPFYNAKYETSGQEIESVNNPGIAGVLMGAAKLPYDYAYGIIWMQCWGVDTDDT